MTYRCDLNRTDFYFLCSHAQIRFPAFYANIPPDALAIASRCACYRLSMCVFTYNNKNITINLHLFGLLRTFVALYHHV